MNKRSWFLSGAVIFIIVLLGSMGGVFSSPPPDKAEHGVSKNGTLLAPEKVHSRTGLEILKFLKKKHYRKLRINDDLSETVFDRYLSDLDHARSYFLKEDIDAFAPYRKKIDNALKKGDLTPAFSIFNRYQQRYRERLLYLLSLLDKGVDGLDFTVEETIETDRKNAPWPADRAELDEIWRKRLKSRVLALKLADNPPEKIVELLEKRFNNQLKRLDQTNSEDVFRFYMNAVSQSFDPHTLYFSPRTTESFDIMMSLSLEGIGAILQTKNEYTEVLRLVTAGPAEKGGQLKPGDRIVGVGQGIDGSIVDVVGWRIDDVVAKIRGPKNTVVRLEVIPGIAKEETETKVIQITRNTVKLEEQAASKRVSIVERNGKAYRIGIIDLPSFYIDFKALQAGREDYKSTSRDVRRILSELSRENVDGIIMDLRDNGGGGLMEASELTGLFIDEGPTVQIRDNWGKVTRLPDPDPAIVYDGPLVVLVNRMSASASEIFAAAIQDYRRGIVVGSQTFGKGTVQTLQSLNHGQLKFTTAKFYRVSGGSTQHRGIHPDILLPSTYDKEQFGEDALPDALEWDTIGRARFSHYPNLEGAIGKLRGLHEKRIETSPDFEYLIAGLERLEKMRGQTALSLVEKTRLDEKRESEAWRLSMENHLRSAKGLPPYKSFEEIVSDDPLAPEESAGDDEERPDPLLGECENILADFIAMGP